MLAWSNLSIQIYSFVFYCFVNFLCILLFLFLNSLFLWFLVIWSFQDIRNCANGQKDRIILVHFKKIVISMCFVHKPLQNILGKCRRSTRRVTSRPTVRFSQTGIKRCARLERKKWKGVSRSAAVAKAVNGFQVRGGSNDLWESLKSLTLFWNIESWSTIKL